MENKKNAPTKQGVGSSETFSSQENKSIANPAQENKHLDFETGTSFEQLSALAKKYDIKEIWEELQYSNNGVWETLRNIHENYRSRQIKAPDEVRDKAEKLVLELMAPVVDLCEFYFPGPMDIANALKEKHTYKTLPEPDNHGKNEPIYQYTDGVHIHAENELKTDAHKEFLNQWENMLQNCIDEIENNGKNANPRAKPIKERLESALHRGPSAYEISEVMDIIRRTTYADPASINPHSHIPFINGLLNLDTFKLEPFDPKKFFTYRVEAAYLQKLVSLKDAPLFTGYIRSVFDPLDIPMVLQYMGYSLIPGKPRDKVLFIVGREGIGKGVLDRLMEGLLPEGKGAIDLNKLLTSDRFQFSGLDGHVLLTDPEIDRKFRRDAKVSTRNFNTLFGSDTTFNERKFHEGKKQIFFAKGIFLGNLPLFKLNDMAFFRRILLVQTLTDRPTADEPNIHLKILENERDVIATLFIHYLKILKHCGWVFTNELTKESTAELWSQFADPVENFELEYLSEAQGPASEIKVNDLYDFFKEAYCKPKGITPVMKQTFTARISENFTKMRKGPKGNRYYAFVNIDCEGLSNGGKKNDTLDGKKEDASQVGHQEKDEKTLKIRVSRAKRYGVQLMYESLHVRGEERDTLYSNQDTSWTQDENISPEPKTAVSDEKKAVSNLKKVPEKYKTDPQNYDTQNENTAPKNETIASKNQQDEGILLENGNMIRDQLLDHGYLISPDSGTDINGIYYKIGILGMNNLPDKKKHQLDRLFQDQKFTNQNTGALGTTWFTRPLRRDRA
ncbi:MAG: DUF5906 domain-containing protein [Thermoplasmataceae archaeon]|jgi:phage/plasmid-associated DNA primase